MQRASTRFALAASARALTAPAAFPVARRRGLAGGAEPVVSSSPNARSGPRPMPRSSAAATIGAEEEAHHDQAQHVDDPRRGRGDGDAHAGPPAGANTSA